MPTNIIYPLGDKFQRVNIPSLVRLPVRIRSQPKKILRATLRKPLKSLFSKAISLLFVVTIVTIREQSTVEDGEIAAVLVDRANEATLKRVKYQGNLIMLMPDNKEFDPIILDKDIPGRIIGKAVPVSWSIK